MTAIPIATASQIPGLVRAACTPPVLIAASSTLEGVFYNALRVGGDRVFRAVTWIRTHSIENINTIQTIFNIINVGAIFFYAKELLVGLSKTRLFSWINLSSSLLIGGLQLTALSLIALAIGKLCTRWISPALRPKQLISNVTVTEKKSSPQWAAKQLHETKLVLNVALAFFATNRFWFIVSLAGSTYSLLKNAKLKWLTFSQIIPGRAIRGTLPIERIKATYNTLAIDPEQVINPDPCTICLDDEIPNDTAFCTNHVFHRDCIAEHVARGSTNLLRNASILRTATRHYTNGAYSGTTHSYSATIPQENLPSCPNCREIPRQNEVDLEILDSEARTHYTRAHIKGRSSRQPLFEKLLAGYSIVQAGLSYLQKYPELAATIYTVQKVFILIDVVALSMTAYYLYLCAKKKIVVSNNNEWKFNLGALVIAVATISFSYIITSQLHLYLKSASKLKDLLGGISPEILKNIDINWAAPKALKTMQMLSLNRMIATLALSLFSEQRYTHLISAAAQMFSFSALLQLRFLQYTQNLPSPLRQVIATGGSLSGLNENEMINLKMTAEFMIPSSCRSTPTHLQATVKSIYNSMSKLIDKSKWDKYWRNTYQNGRLISRNLIYSATLQANPTPACECTLPSALNYLKMDAYTNFSGRSNVEIVIPSVIGT